MTDQPPPEATPASPSDPDTSAATEAAAPARRSTRKLIAGGAGVLVAAALVGGGAFAYTQLSGGGPQPHDVMPESMQAYARLDLDPSASQKVELFQLLRKIPDAAEEIGDAEDTDLRELIVDELVADTCEDIDYEQDVEPWLGQRIGIGANLADEQLLVAAQVTDEDAAREGIDALAECGDQEIGLAFTEGYALISDQQKTVDDAIDATAEGSLGDKQEFVDSMDDLGEQGIASVWFDGKALAESLPELGLPESEAAQLEELEQAGASAVALRVDGSAIELAGVSGLPESYDVTGAPVGDLPGDTVLALSLAGLGDRVGPQFESFLDQLDSFAGPQVDTTAPELDEETLDLLDPETRELYEESLQPTTPGDTVDGFLSELESETGIVLPDDLATLLGDSITLAVGRANLEDLPASQGPEDLADLDVAISTRGDGPAIVAVLDKIVDLASEAGVELVTDSTEDGAVLATNGDAAKAVLADGDLGEQDTFTSVMPYGDDTSQAFYLDLSAVLDAIEKADPPQDVREVVEDLAPLRAVGASFAKTGEGKAGFSLRVSFDD